MTAVLRLLADLAHPVCHALAEVWRALSSRGQFLAVVTAGAAIVAILNGPGLLVAALSLAGLIGYVTDTGLRDPDPDGDE